MTDQAKPPYRIPLMREIAATKRNGYKVVSTFSGCGGSCLGFEMAGFEIIYANEFIAAARETYAANHGFEPDGSDIRQVDADRIRAFAIRRGLLEPGEEIDVLEGSPPCASFSMAGKRAKSWGEIKQYSETKQRVDDLFFEFTRLLAELQPKMFVAENVSGLVRGVAKGYFKEIHAALGAAGYRVKAKLLDAQWLGVPQSRQRVIFIGTRNDLDLEPGFPKPLPYNYTVRDALPHIARIQGRTGQHFAKVDSELDEPFNSVLVTDPEQTRYELEDGPKRSWKATATHRRKVNPDRPVPTVLQNDRGMAQLVMEEGSEKLNIERYAIGRAWIKTPIGKASKRYFNLRRPDPDKASPTLTQAGGIMGAAAVVHPTEPRRFTIPELRRLCGFPDDFVLTGDYGQQWERLGRAVPPPMMEKVALAVRDSLAST